MQKTTENQWEHKDGYIPTMKEYMDSIREKRIIELLETTKAIHSIAYYRPVKNNFIISFVKRVIRKLIVFCVKPAIDDQNEFNAKLCAVVELQRIEMQSLKTEINKLKQNKRASL